MSDDEHLGIECGRCHRSISGAVVANAVEYDDDGEQYRLTLVRCPGCGAVNLVGQTLEYFGEWEVGKPVRHWPSPVRGLSYDAPAAIRDDFAEAGRCVSVDAYTAAALMARRVLEGIAVDQGATKRTLGEMLTELQGSGAIDGRLGQWADALRVVGNDAAHLRSVSHEDASDALAFAEALADYVYTFRARWEQFTARRASADDGPGAPPDSFD